MTQAYKTRAARPAASTTPRGLFLLAAAVGTTAGGLGASGTLGTVVGPTGVLVGGPTTSPVPVDVDEVTGTVPEMHVSNGGVYV